MDLKLGTYLVYLAVSIVLTVWVARTLKRNGQVFLDDAFEDERLAESVNHLLVVGFYLLNLGYVAVALKISKATLDDGSEAMEALAMNFFNLYVLSRFRRRRMLEKAAPPVLPGRMMAPVGAPLAAPMPVPPFPYGPPRNPAPPANRPTSPYSGPAHPAPEDPAPPR